MPRNKKHEVRRRIQQRKLKVHKEQIRKERRLEAEAREVMNQLVRNRY